METVNNVVTATRKAIWGEQKPTANETAGDEPVSGLQGTGTATDPYDQGNSENPTEPTGKSDMSNPLSTSNPEPTSTSNREPTTSSNTEPISTTNREPASTTNREPASTTNREPASTTNREPASASNRDLTSTSNPEPTSETQTPMNPNSAATGRESEPLETTEGTGVTGASAQKYRPKGSDVIPSESSNNQGAVPTSGASPTQKLQGAEKPKDAPADERADAVKATKDDAEEAMKKRDPNDHSGEPMHIHDANTKIPETQAERRDSKAGMPGGQEHGKLAKGTGEIWEKSTGLHADGGDFDATRPGAGKEADRLLEEKGIHNGTKSSMDQPQSPASSEGKEKVSKMEKLKDKLHIGHKKG